MSNGMDRQKAMDEFKRTQCFRRGRFTAKELAAEWGRSINQTHAFLNWAKATECVELAWQNEDGRCYRSSGLRGPMLRSAWTAERVAEIFGVEIE